MVWKKDQKLLKLMSGIADQHPEGFHNQYEKLCIGPTAAAELEMTTRNQSQSN